MSETAVTATETVTEQTTEKPAGAITDWEAEAKKWEKRAKDAWPKVKEYDALIESQKTEQDRAAEAMTKALNDAETAKQEALRFRLAARHGISDEDAELFLTGSSEEVMERQAQRWVAANMAAATAGPRADLSQGNSNQDTALNGDPLEDAIKSKLGIT